MTAARFNAKLPLDKNATPKEWLDGMFDAYTFALLELV